MSFNNDESAGTAANSGTRDDGPRFKGYNRVTLLNSEGLSSEGLFLKKRIENEV